MTAQKSPPNFFADPAKCIACGQCAADCVAAIIKVEDGNAKVVADRQDTCIRCQHCLDICPTGAATVAGLVPEDSEKPAFPDPKSIDLLMRSRRSVRKFAPGQVDRALFDRVLTTAAHAPTGANVRNRHFTVIFDSEVMDELRNRTCRFLMDKADTLPEDISWMAGAASAWLEKGRDILFRTAPHLMIVTCAPGAVTPAADCLIALSYFELAAQTNGIGTVWCGLMEMVLQNFPELRAWYGIPEDHVMGYVALFGPSGITYQRCSQHEAENVKFLAKLG